MDINQNITVTSTSTSTKMTTLMERLNSTTTTTKIPKFKCPEEERPISIGSYEVPTQRDLVLMTKAMLTKLFNAYNTKALFLLKDIKEASKATAIIEKKCQETDKAAYRQCVKRVSNKSALIIKNLIASLENQKIDVAALTQEKICNLTSMKTDPLELIKILAQENASLQFALPGFLRLLSACSFYCSQTQSKDYNKKPPLLMTDLELVVKHFLKHFS